MLKRIISFCFAAVLLASLVLSVISCSRNETDRLVTDALTASQSDAMCGVLARSDDLGKEYIDQFIFLGESTTYHLKSRGVLSGGTDTKQVWAPKSGTLMLDATTADCRIIYPESNEEMDLCEAMKIKRPEYMLLTFGLNGAVGSISRGSEYFKDCYLKLIEALRSASPDTVIILGSCFPIATNMDMRNYTVDVSTLNGYIDTINEWTLSLATEEGLPFLNTAEVLKDEEGMLRLEYQVGDGHHLTAEAYKMILQYIRTHGYKK